MIYSCDAKGETGCFSSKSSVLHGRICQADTMEEAIEELESNEKEWLKIANCAEIKIPELTNKKSEKVSLFIRFFLF